MVAVFDLGGHFPVLVMKYALIYVHLPFHVLSSHCRESRSGRLCWGCGKATGTRYKTSGAPSMVYSSVRQIGGQAGCLPCVLPSLLSPAHHANARPVSYRPNARRTTQTDMHASHVVSFTNTALEAPAVHCCTIQLTAVQSAEVKSCSPLVQQ